MSALPAPALSTPFTSVDAQDLAAWNEHRDEAAFARLVQRHTAMVTGICRRRLGNSSVADEAAQAVFIVLVRRVAKAASAPSLGAWLYGVAIRVCRDAERATTRRRHHERRAESPRPPDCHPDVEWTQVRPHLDHAIADLSAAQQQVVIGHFLEGRTQAAVAASLGISEDAARKRIDYALDRLRSWFGRRGLTISGVALASGLASEMAAAEPALVAACTHAGLHPASSPGAAALAGGGSGMIGAVSVAAVLLVAVGGFASWQMLTPAPALAAVAPADPPPPGPALVAGVPGPKLAPLLKQTVVARFRRDYLGEILKNLEDQTGVDAVFPPGIDRLALITIESEAISLGETLQRIADAGGFTLNYIGDQVVFWQSADDTTLAGLMDQLRTGDSAARQDAVYDLSLLGDPRIYPPLFQALSDPDPVVGHLAVRCLYQHPLSVQRTALQPIEALMPWLRDTNTTDYAAHALGQTRDPRAVDALLALAREPRLEFGAAAIDGLSLCRDPRAVATLHDLVERLAHETGDVQLSSETRANIYSTYDVAQLIEQANNSEDNIARYAIASGRDHCRDPRVLELLLTLAHGKDASRPDDGRWICGPLARTGDPRALECLIQMASDSDLWVRRNALGSLAKTRDPQSIDLMHTALREKSRTEPLYLFDDLASTRDPRAFALLARYLSDATTTIDERLYAARNIGKTRDARALDFLIPLTKDKNPELQDAAFESLAELAVYPHVMTLLIDLIPTGDSLTQARAARALTASSRRGYSALMSLVDWNGKPPTRRGWLAGFTSNAHFGSLYMQPPLPPRVVRQLVTWAEDPDCLAESCPVLAICREPAVVSPLSAALALPNADQECRATAARNLGAIRLPHAVDVLLKLSQSAVVRDVTVALEGLSCSDDPRAVARAKILAQVDNEKIRAAAAWCLFGKIRDADVPDIALALAQDPVPYIRKISTGILSRWRHDPDVYALGRALAEKDPDPAVRSRARHYFPHPVLAPTL